ncbi:hypothetical protein NBH00_14650 [Paraconexibacter antarcticus]|uniref:Tetratricopeptide repeat protein n=1 Tax=Paraconexibacter antarcticus TaxID=2949664 RepID=A0ABY5DM34_9ACTN|nr:hypothetical protein [Paraconexibacter antarcticus]UTI62599.1 hypothetical protein NBH00_14650 [Paraconexibacter antarcticus]
MAAVWLAGNWREARHLHQAQDAVASGRLVDAARLAASASGPMVDVDARRTQAIVALRSGDLAGAQRDIETALRTAPNDWALRRDDAVLLLRLGARSAARAQMRRALALNPRMPLPGGFVTQRP